MTWGGLKTKKTYVCLASLVVAEASSFLTSFFASGFGPSLKHDNCSLVSKQACAH